MKSKMKHRAALRKPVEEPVIEHRRYRYMLLEDKMKMEYEISDEPPVFHTASAQELLDDKADRNHYRFERNMQVIAHSGSGKERYMCRGISLSSQGMIVRVASFDVVEELEAAGKIQLQFKLYPGDLPEDFSMNLKVNATLVQSIYTDEDEILCAFRFREPLAYYDNLKRASYMTGTAVLYLLAFMACFMLLYTESIWCLRYNGILYRGSMLVFAFAFGRYLFSACYKPLKMSDTYFPKVTVIISNMGSGKNIQRTVASCRRQHYPKTKMEIMIMNGCSSKGETLIRGARSASGNLLVFVGDGSVLHPDAIRQLVQPFQDPHMGAVTGSPRVRNRYSNFFTRVLAMEYFHRFRVKKAREACFDSVAGISGELCCYRKDIVLERKMVKQYRTSYQDSALVFVNVPSSGEYFWKIQKRNWRAGWKESVNGLDYVIRKEPFVLLFCYLNKIAYAVFPILLIYGLVVVPLVYQVVPFVYIMVLVALFVLTSLLQIRMTGFEIRKPRRTQIRKGGNANE